MNEQALNEFLKRFADNRHTEQEHMLFINWLNTAPVEEIQKVLDNYQHISEMQLREEPVQYPQLVEKIEARLNELNEEETQAEYAVRLWPLIRKIASIAAIFFITTAIGLFFLINRNSSKPLIVKNEKNRIYKNEIPSNKNRAILTLSDGSKINLDNAKNEILVTQDGVNIRKTSSGEIVYEVQSLANQDIKISYNTISTPRGGQYQIVLPDGSKVWLNAASSLKFPVSFSHEERRVELVGEAYFEVAKLNPHSGEHEGSRIPFKVTSGNQVLEVLGTHFNINAYPDEATINTTLLEGSVKIEQLETHNSKVLKPGQQAKVGADIRVSNVDVSQVIAWKNGYFIFSHENIESIMRKISRWYDVDIEYKGNITQEGFVGSVSRFEKVSQVLDMLQMTGLVHFKIEKWTDEPGQKERRIIVMP